MTGSRAVATWVAATAAMVLASASSGRPSPDEPALADVVRGAQTAELNLETLPAGYHGPGSSADSMQSVLDQVPTQLTKYYVGTLLARKVTQHQNGIRQMAEGGGAGGRIGGVKTLALQDVWVSGATATVSAEVTVWFKSAQFWYQPITNQPAETNVIDLELHLVKDGRSWKIDQEHWQFAPGGGP